jgi:predicted transglutaminase-like cysteine proteinase
MMKNVVIMIIFTRLLLGADMEAYRLEEMHKFLAKLRDKPLKEKLVRVNFYFNQIKPEYDYDMTIADEWDDRETFIKRGYGDCEEYAIAKYQSLKELGVDPNKLFLTVVKVQGKPYHHLILTYHRQGKRFALDNLSWKIVPMRQRTDLKTVVSFNERYIVDRKIEYITPQKLGRYLDPKNWYDIIKKL